MFSHDNLNLNSLSVKQIFHRGPNKKIDIKIFGNVFFFLIFIDLLYFCIHIICTFRV